MLARKYSLHRSNIVISFRNESNVLVVEGNCGKLSCCMQGDEVVFGKMSLLIRSKANLRYLVRLVGNMSRGVSEGYFIELQCVGLGYRFVLLNKFLIMKLGYCNYLRCTYNKNVYFVGHRDKLIIYGLELGEVRRFGNLFKQLRKPDAYKGKGIRYAGESIILKVGKQK